MQTDEAKQNIIGFTQPADFYFRAAQRAFHAEDIPNAVFNARTAVRKDPDNAEYGLLLAQILIHARQHEESLQILFDLLRCGDGAQETECLFLLGLNFLALDDHEKAQECFGEYMSLEPEGVHAEEIDEYLTYDGPEYDPSLYYFDDLNEHEARLKSSQVKMDLENGRYRQAARILESVPAGQADKPYIRNNLAMALFFSGQQERALEITRSVLEKDPDNIHANCNMMVFLSRLDRLAEAAPYISRLDGCEPSAADDKFRIAAAFCDIEDHERAYHAMHEYNLLGEGDVRSLFCEGIAAYNTGRIREAVSVLSDVRKIDYPAIIAEYYLQRMNAVLADPDTFVPLPYIYRLPPEESGRRVLYLNECLRMNQADFQQLWREDREFEDTLLWVMNYADENVQIAVCVIIAGFGDLKAEKMLRRFLLSITRPDVVKNEILVLLDHIGAQGPYLVYLSGELVEVHVNADDGEDAETDAEAARLYESIRDLTQRRGAEDLLQQALHFGAGALRSARREEFLRYPQETAAAALWLAGDAAGRSLPLPDLAAAAGVRPEMVRRYVDMLL